MPQSLSPREGQILGLVAAGLTSKAIAGRLGIGESTVNWHLANALRKLGAASRAEAVAIAMREGLLSDVPMPPVPGRVARSRWRLSLLIATIAFLIATPILVASAVLSPTRMPPPATPTPRSQSPTPAATTPSVAPASPTIAATPTAARATAMPAPIPAPSIGTTPVLPLRPPSLPELTGAPLATPTLPELAPPATPLPEILPLLPAIPRLP